MADFAFTPVFWKLYDAAATHPRYISMPGGTRSGKTYSTLQFLHLLIPKADKAGDINSVVSETLPHLKRGAIRDFERILGHSLKIDPQWNASDLVYTYPNEAKLEFFSADTSDKVLGPARKRLFLNECNHIDYDTARQLFVRTTGLIIMDYNPASTFWAIEQIEPRKNCVTIHSTYKDNTFLSDEQIAEIESNRDDRNWWTVYGEGKVGTLDGLIYDFDLIDALPSSEGLVEVQGLDFGFTNDPTARVRCLVDTKRKAVYVDERCYRTRMLNADIVEDLRRDGVTRAVPVYADCAEPKTIAEISQAGFNVRPCTKGAPVRSDKLTFQLQWMQGWTLHVTKASLNLINELRNYTWDKDRDGRPTNYPIDKFNHCFTGDTLIETEHGPKRIDEIIEGEKVWTSGGLRRVERLFKNGCKKIWNISIIFANFTVRMSVTPDHKVKVGEQWKKVSELKKGDTLWLSRFLTERNTDYILENDISQGGQGACIESSGNTTTARSRQDTKSTTKTAIRRIMTSAISSASRLKPTVQSILTRLFAGGNPKSPASICSKSDPLQQSGIGAKKGESGTGCTQSERKRRRLNVPASAAGPNSCPHTQTQDFAPINARQNGDETSTSTRREGLVSSAGKSSARTNLETPFVAVAAVVQDIEFHNAEQREVFDLCVNDIHEYFANGILVHNCLDALRYALYTHFGQQAGVGHYTLGYARNNYRR